MRINFIFFFIAFTLYSQAQSPYNGIDSVKNISWHLDVFMSFADKNGNDSVPSAYTRTEYTLENRDGLVTVYEWGPQPVYSLGGAVPKECLYKEKVGSNNTVSSKIKGENYTPPDSVVLVDQAKFEQYFLDHKDSLKIDTIRICSDKIEPWNDQDDKIYECSYKQNKKDGTERGYYTISELKGVCITENFRLKYSGEWKAGKKNGNWKEYDKTGKLISVKKYKHDKLVKETSY
jgi:hypothetical protein